MLRRISRFFALSLADQVFLVRAAMELWRVRRRLRSSGFREFRRRGVLPAGLTAGPESWATGCEGLSETDSADTRVADPVAVKQETDAQLRRTARLVWAAHYLLPGRSTCLDLALTVQRLLEKQQISSQVRIGVRKSAGEFEAHAWLESCGRVVIGGNDVHEQYSVLPPLGVSAIEKGRE